MIIDIDSIRFQKIFYGECLIALAPVKQTSDKDIPNLAFHRAPFSRTNTNVPPSFIEKDVFLKFTVANNSDSIRKSYFWPSRYCKNVELFQAKSDSIQQTFVLLHDSVAQSQRYGGCKILTLPPRDTMVYYARFNFVRSNINSFSPRLIEMDYLTQALAQLKQRDSMLDVVTYVATGILLLMIFYSLAAYMQYLNIEFIYYSAYAFCSALLLFTKALLNLEHSGFYFFYEEFLDFIILCTGVFFYLAFVRRFLDTKHKYPRLDKYLGIAKIVFIGMLALFTLVYFLSDKYVILMVLENYVIKFFLCGIGIAFVIYSFTQKSVLLKYLAAGNVSLVLFSMMSLLVLIFKWRVVPSDANSIFNKSLFYYEVGIILELIFFLAGVAYKNRVDIIQQVKERERFKLETERKEFEKQMAVMAAQQEERNRISADMHDELGSGVTAIRLMSEIVKSKMKQTSLPEIEKISNSANDLLGKMNTIIWTMKSSNDTLESLVAYIRAHAIEFFDSTPIDCTVTVDQKVPDVEMTGEKRRNIFLSIKEALNNIMKHSHASKVHIDIVVDDDLLKITIADNGIGIDKDKLRRFGNGMSNMKRRMQSINGEVTIENNGGTVLTFELPV